MALKRLFWYFDLHGGAAGSIVLGAGYSPEGFIVWPGGLFLLQLDDVSGTGTPTFSFGTLDYPDLLASGWAPGDLTTGSPRLQLLTVDPPVAVPSRSPWTFTISGGDLTSGVVECAVNLTRLT